MPAIVSILNPVVSVQPGGEATTEVRVRNTGTVVDQFALNLVGEASAWARCDPPVISLFPDAEETVRIHFSPARSSAVTAGLVHYGVRVTCQEDKDFSVVEEGAVQISSFSGVQARVVPRTSEGKRTANHRVEVTNTGNAVADAEVWASDPDELLGIDVDPNHLSIEPGATAVAKVKVVAKKGPTRTARRIPFQVHVEAGGPPVDVEGAFEQTAKSSSVLVFVAIAVLAAILVLVFRDQASGVSLSASVSSIL
ncbi:MAG: hypothetical protein KY454_05275 [Actinobacteria bacterium]|nr:hypothetical protein [Actinomycetota bacterium]MBW3649148.1 hypothetical protein [Actinomycetota bacterium]